MALGKAPAASVSGCCLLCSHKPIPAQPRLDLEARETESRPVCAPTRLLGWPEINRKTPALPVPEQAPDRMISASYAHRPGNAEELTKAPSPSQDAGDKNHRAFAVENGWITAPSRRLRSVRKDTWVAGVVGGHAARHRLARQVRVTAAVRQAGAGPLGVDGDDLTLA